MTLFHLIDIPRTGTAAACTDDTIPPHYCSSGRLPVKVIASAAHQQFNVTFPQSSDKSVLLINHLQTQQEVNQVCVSTSSLSKRRNEQRSMQQTGQTYTNARTREGDSISNEAGIHAIDTQPSVQTPTVNRVNSQCIIPTVNQPNTRSSHQAKL